MKEIKGNLLDGDWDVAVHCANTHQVMGAGVALALKNKWPEVYEADLDDDRPPEKKYGKFSVATIDKDRFVINLYAQVGIGSQAGYIDRNCRYDLMYNSLYRSMMFLFKEHFYGESLVKIGVPHGMGCGLAGGSWRIIEAILLDIENIYDVEFVVYKLQ